MFVFGKSAVVGLGLLAGIAMGAQAQTAVIPTPGSSVASLPPAEQGPRASSYMAVPQAGHVAAAPSVGYVGPAPGAGTGHMPPRFEKSAGWDVDPTNKPYEGGKGPRPN